MLIPRSLCPHEDWEKIAGDEYYRMSGLAREYLAGLPQILNEHRRILFLGGPGMGLSSLAWQIQEYLISERGRKPILASLRSFDGELSAILNPPRHEGTDGEDLTGSSAWYLLDDLDQVGPAHLPPLIAELNRLVSEKPDCHVALFARQGYTSVHPAPFDPGFSRYYLLGLTSADVQQACDAEGIDSSRFEEELERLDLGVEAGNPAVLRTLIALYHRHGRFPDTRTAVFDEILRSLGLSTDVDGSPRQESLRALGLAMELASRNFLTPAESELAIGARLDLSPPEAATLLREVSSFLLYTPEGISFPHRSFGEFSAACALRDQRLSLVLDLVFFPGTRMVNLSWKSALCFLTEMHPSLRSFLVAHHPELALAASLSVLTVDERGAIGRRLYAHLRDRKEPLAHHPEISVSRLAQCLQACELKALEDDAKQRIDSTLACNAFLLLGEADVSTALPLALATAMDTTVDRPIRDCAFHCVGALGSAALIPELIAGVDRADSCYVSMLISISRLADEAAVPKILPALLASQTHITSAYERLRRLQPKPIALMLLAMIQREPGLTEDFRWRFYASSLPAAIRRGWDKEVAAAAIDALIAIEQAQVLDLQNDFMDELGEAIGGQDREEIVVREVLRRLGDHGQPVAAIARTLLRLSSPATIRWLLAQTHGERFVSSLRMYARGKLYQVFEDVRPLPSAAQDPQLMAWEREHRDRVEEMETSVARAHETVREDRDFARAVNAAIFLGEDRLPTVSPERAAWLAEEVDRRFPEVDFSKIAWHENSCTIPWLLHCLLLLVHHYRLHLTDDVPLIKSLNSLRGEAAEFHANEYGLSALARAELEDLIRDPNLNYSAVHTVLHFVRQTGIWTLGIAAALQLRALSADPLARGPAIFTLCALPQSTDVLIAITSQKQLPVPDSILDELVRRQHRPTIERRLSQALNDTNLLVSGEVDFPETGPLDWIGNIHLPEVWKKLTRLRGVALKLGLSRLVGTVTGAMAKIDEARLASSMAGQVGQAPKAWQPWQQTRVIESRQRARLAQAKTTEFRKVVAKLQMKSTEKLLKIWCEGVTDLPALNAFLTKAIGRRDDVVLQPIGGWGELSNPNWPLDRLWDGCLDVVVIADGDNGRDWTRADRPLSDDGKSLMKRLEAVGVTGFVLKRAGIENYFSRAAVESTLGPVVAQHFPLPDEARAKDIPDYPKGNNGLIAERMVLDDLKGTDLYDILEELRRRIDAIS